MTEASKMDITQFIEDLMLDPEREPVASELGGANCLSRCRA